MSIGLSLCTRVKGAHAYCGQATEPFTAHVALLIPVNGRALLYITCRDIIFLFIIVAVDVACNVFALWSVMKQQYKGVFRPLKPRSAVQLVTGRGRHLAAR